MKNKYYCYFQPNKKDLKDNYGGCSVRCICKALDLDWKEAYKKLIPYILEYQCPFMGMTLEIYKKVFCDMGFEYYGISNKKGSKRPTVKEFAKDHPEGTYILSLAHHLVCVKDGKYYDTWDCGWKSLYGYYERKK